MYIYIYTEHKAPRRVAHERLVHVLLGRGREAALGHQRPLEGLLYIYIYMYRERDIYIYTYIHIDRSRACMMGALSLLF